MVSTKHNSEQPGLFITVEGSEGVGKSTAVKLLGEMLVEQKIPHLLTREPGGTKIGEAIRQIILTPREEELNSVSELLLMFAARAQHLQEVVKPGLAAGKWVLCDRFTDATYAYQGGGRGLPLSDITQLEAMVQKGLQPDLTILLDAPVELALERARQRGALDRIEQEQVSFFNRVRQAYLDRATQYPERFILIDGAQELSKVQEQLAQALQNLVAVCYE